MGGGSSSTTQVRKRDPEPQGLTDLRNNISNMLSPILGGEKTTWWNNTDFGKTFNELQNQSSNAINSYNNYSNNFTPLLNNLTSTSGKAVAAGDQMQNVSNNIGNLSGKIEGVGDRQSQLASDVEAFTKSGNLPEGLLSNMLSSVNSELNRNTGSALNSLASKGIMNSSVANRSINNLSNAAAEAYSKNYLDAYNAVLNGYGKTNDVLSSAGDTYSKAITGQNNNLAGLKSAVDAYGTANTGYNNAITANTNMMNSMAAMPKTLTESMLAPYQIGYQFWKDWQNSYDNREDYDTIVSSGK